VRVEESTIGTGAGRVSGIFVLPDKPRALLVLAHGAGAGMRHVSITALAEGLAARSVASLRYQFPYMERGSGRPDPPPVCHETVRAALSCARQRVGELPLFAGGRSFGGRMTSQAAAGAALDVRGLIFFAFPLHPAKQPGVERAAHLRKVASPMLFLQGSRDALAELPLLEGVVRDLGERAQLVLAPHADHSFHVPARSGATDSGVLNALLDAADAWMGRLAS
jgi:predicted alpha/beta-hydrolase family hydrolase